MVISSKHKYLFIQVPHTASTAIEDELCSQYDGERILKKHSTLYDFMACATKEEKKYYIFATIRNPLEIIVTKYNKIASNHRGKLTSPECVQYLRKRRNGRLNIKRYNYMQSCNAEFAEYFAKFYNRPFNNLFAAVQSSRVNVMRYENLNSDFEATLKTLGIAQKRRLPVVNKTKKKKDLDLLELYKGQYDRAARVLGPLLMKNGYAFPEDWPTVRIPVSSKIYFEIDEIARFLYYFSRAVGVNRESTESSAR